MSKAKKRYVLEFRSSNSLWELEQTGVGSYGELKIQDNHPQLIVEENKIKYAKRRAKHFYFIIFDEKYNRSSTYRGKFFKYNPPDGKLRFKKKNYWRCHYCGKKLTKDKVQVDHVIPVYKAKRYIKWQRRLPNGVNDVDNLVAACRMCNQLKGKKTGYWYLRAKLGYFPLFRKIWGLSKIVVIVISVILILYTIKINILPDIVNLSNYYL